MSRSSERPLAPHVQAAIAAGQGKMVGQATRSDQGGGRPVAAHVRAAIEGGWVKIAGQAKMGRGRRELQVAVPVRASVAVGPAGQPLQLMYDLRSKSKVVGGGNVEDLGKLFTSGKPPGSDWENPSPYIGKVPKDFIKRVWMQQFEDYCKRKLPFVWFEGYATVYIKYTDSGSADIALCDDKFGKQNGMTWHHTGIGKKGIPDLIGNYMQQVPSYLHECTFPHVGGEFMGHGE